MKVPTVRSWALVAVAAVPIVFGLATLATVAGRALGWNPLWPADTYNIAEQASIRNMAGVLHQQRLGWDINGRYPVRPDLLPQRTRWATPLEAGIYTRESWFVQFLLDQGARVDSGNRVSLVCLARRANAPDVEQQLSQGSKIECPEEPSR